MLQLVYGGTFDPFHNGHLAIARAAHDEFGVPVHLMPAADPPHRAPPGATASERAHLLDVAVKDIPGLCVDRRELRRAQHDPAGRSYTIDTLRELRGEQGDAVPIALLIGADSLLGLPTWRAWTALFDLTHFIVADRPGSPLADVVDPVLAQAVAGRWASHERELFHAPGGRLLRLQAPLREESATAVRAQIQAGGPWERLLPAPVAGYILDHRLYGATPS